MTDTDVAARSSDRFDSDVLEADSETDDEEDLTDTDVAALLKDQDDAETDDEEEGRAAKRACLHDSDETLWSSHGRYCFHVEHD